MQPLERVLKKIDENITEKLNEIKRSTEQKKSELKQKYAISLEQEKLKLKTEFQQKLELGKKRIYTEKFIEYNKKVEEVKNYLLNILLDKIKQELLSMDKTEYYKFFSNVIEKNLFLNQHNTVIFDSSEKLNRDEQKKLINEILQKLKDKSTTLELGEESGLVKFGVKIVCGKKSKEFTLDTIIDLIKPYCEEKINQVMSKIL